MKAPPSPPGRRVSIILPPLADLTGTGTPSDSPPDTTTMSGDSHGPVLLNDTHALENLANVHLDDCDLMNGGHSDPILVNSGHSDPILVNSGHSDPILVNSGHSDPILVNGGHSDPILVNGGHSDPILVNSGHSDPILVNSTPIENKLTNGSHIEPNPIGPHQEDNQNGTEMNGDHINALNKVNGGHVVSNQSLVVDNGSEGERRGVGLHSGQLSVPRPSPHRRVSRDTLFYFPEPRRVGYDGVLPESPPLVPSDPPSPTHHKKPSIQVERMRSVLTEGNKEAVEEAGGDGGVTQERTQKEMEQMSRKLGDMSPFVRQHLLHVESRFFDMFGDKEKQTININKFLMALAATGLRHSDPRLKETCANLKKVQEKMALTDLHAFDIDYETFMNIVSENLEVLVKAFSASFIIPDFRGFCHHLDQIYKSCLANTNGKVASYIPQLARSKPEHWAFSVCTVDGQRYSQGDVKIPFTLQSCSKPLTYAMALGLNGTDTLHSYIGMEPSGRYFNELCLDYNNKPHNPMINAGAIMTAALIKPQLSAADRFDFVFNMYKRLAGDEFLGFNNAVFLSEKECADRNFALAYFMRENKCFPEGTRLHETLDFYFQLCSLEITAESGAVMAATLANGGVNPLTGDPVLTVDAVRNTLTLMHSCGMYNYSGQFAFKVGLPSKSGVSGCVLLVVPNTMGICLWSPLLDTNGNSCRAVQFCRELVSRFNFHNFDNMRGHFTTKFDPRMVKAESSAQILFDLLFSSAAGDLSALKRHWLSGTDMQAQDYDGRTALHVATSEGHVEIVEYLLLSCQVHPLPKDRWSRTPLDDAVSFNHPLCARLILESCKRKEIEMPSVPQTVLPSLMCHSETTA